MRKFVTVVVAGAVGVLVAGLAVGAESTPPEVEKRQKLMKDIGKQFGKVKAYVQEGKGELSDVERAGHSLVGFSTEIAELFPAGTGRGTLDDKTTRALPKIWEDEAGFQAAIKALDTEATKLAELAADGKADDIKAQFAVLGKEGCGNCHDSFRGPKVE